MFHSLLNSRTNDSQGKEGTKGHKQLNKMLGFFHSFIKPCSDYSYTSFCTDFMAIVEINYSYTVVLNGKNLLAFCRLLSYSWRMKPWIRRGKSLCLSQVSGKILRTPPYPQGWARVLSLPTGPLHRALCWVLDTLRALPPETLPHPSRPRGWYSALGLCSAP